MDKKEHLTQEGLMKIVNLRASLNNGLSNKLITYFPGAKKIDRMKPIIPDILNFD
jgi:hypothetical protein